jgi:hypothetical protein
LLQDIPNALKRIPANPIPSGPRAERTGSGDGLGDGRSAGNAASGRLVDLLVDRLLSVVDDLALAARRDRREDRQGDPSDGGAGVYVPPPPDLL